MKERSYSFISNKRYTIICLIFLLSLIIASNISDNAFAETVNEAVLRAKINDQNSKIIQLQKEIEQYQNEINKVSEESKTLQSTIKELDLNIKKLNKEILLTENQISSVNMTIDNLSLDINKNENTVSAHRITLEKLISIQNQQERQTFIEVFLNNNSVNEVWDYLNEIETVNSNLKDRISEIQKTTTILSNQKADKEVQRNRLNLLKSNLKSQKEAINIVQSDKKTLLAQTKNKESNYKKILEQKASQKAEFEKEMFDFESALKIAIDMSKLPKTGTGVLLWPLDSVKITQYFGNTDFANQNSAIYNGKGHNGIDLRASIGTPVKSASTGKIRSTGNTDAVSGCYSYGKWVLIDHENGLSTLYGHLSLINVSAGQNVISGQIIGYSGNTGVSTGPHLHFSVFASDGVTVTKATNSRYCKNAFMPLADLKAYLNPLSYL